MEKSLHCIVSGKVQGVYFRAFVQEQADSLSLRGWVRNLKDGRVEVLAQGDPASWKDFTERLMQGPVMARVDRVVFGAHDPKAGAIGSLWDVVRDPRLNHRPEVVAGVLAGQCAEDLRSFFASHRG